TLFQDGEASRAHDLGIEALALAREVGDRRHTATALNTLGWMALAENHLNEARELLVESLAVALEIAFRSLLYDGLFGLAAVAGADGEWRRAARLEAAAESQQGDAAVSTNLGSWQRDLIDQHRAAAQAQTDPDEWEAARAGGATLTIEQAAAEILEL